MLTAAGAGWGLYTRLDDKIDQGFDQVDQDLADVDQGLDDIKVKLAEITTRQTQSVSPRDDASQ